LGLFFREKLNYDGVDLSIIVLAKLMDRRSNADEAVLIREDCKFALLSNDGLFVVCVSSK